MENSKSNISKLKSIPEHELKLKKYYDNFMSLLEPYKVKTKMKSQPYSFVSMGAIKGIYNIEEKDYYKMISNYAKAVDKGCIFGLAEKQKEYGPLIIDLDIETPSQNYIKIQDYIIMR